MKIDTRTYKLDKRNDFKFRNICLLKSIKINKNREIRNISMIINDVEIKPTKINANNVYKIHLIATIFLIIIDIIFLFYKKYSSIVQ